MLDPVVRPPGYDDVDLDQLNGTADDSTCPLCSHPIPAEALAVINEKLNRGEPAECDYCPY